MKNVTVVEIVKDEKGQLARVEQGALTEYGVNTFNFAIKDLPYDEAVENQIKEQQKLTMQVQTSIASAKQAEQRAITVAKEGEADAAKAKWEQEVIKAKYVTEAEQQRDVAKLQKDAAEFNKQKLILEGQGEAEKRRAIMAADGALQQKLAAYVEVNKMYADAIKNAQNPLTPSVVMGNGSTTNVGSTLADMLMVKTARELGISVNPAGNAPVGKK
jgi:regulator of protease activity HflC (stomatin/prohibitin superfamily)